MCAGGMQRERAAGSLAQQRNYVTHSLHDGGVAFKAYQAVICFEL